MDLSSMDVWYVAKELQAFADAKVERIVQSDTNRRDVLFTLYLRDHPKLHLRFLLPGMIALLPTKPEAYPTVPPGFAMFLRKYLDGSRLVSASQKGFDRILEIRFSRAGKEMLLIIEMLPPGNMILVIDGQIRNLMENANFKDRTLRGGIPYAPPPPSLDLSLLSEEEIIEKISSGTRESIVKIIAIELGLGGVYAEEVCVRAGVEKTKNGLQGDEPRAIASAIKGLFEESIQPSTSADGMMVFPFPLQSRETIPCEEKIFLSALYRFAKSNNADSLVKETEKTSKRKQSKHEKLIVAQEAQLEQMERIAQESHRKGEIIFEQYQSVSEILFEVQSAREKKQNIASVLKKFPQVIRYDESNGTVEVEFS